MSVNSAWPIIPLGIVSTTQMHMAKALERQGIETVDLIRARFQRSGTEIEGKVRKPLIYGLGLVLNHTTFIYHLLVAPLGGTTALNASMYGVTAPDLLGQAALLNGEELALSGGARPSLGGVRQQDVRLEPPSYAFVRFDPG